MIVYIVSEIRALILGIAYMLVHLEFLIGRPLALNALCLHLRAALSAGITTALSCKKQGLAVIEVSAEETTVLIDSGIGTGRYKHKSLKHLTGITHSWNEQLLGIISERQVTKGIAFYI